jgi:uncharacterized protein
MSGNVRQQFKPIAQIFIQGKEISTDAYGDVIDVSYEDSTVELDVVSVTLRNTNLKYTKQTPYLKGCSLKLRMGYAGKEVLDMFDGVINEIESSGGGDSGHILTLKANPYNLETENWNQVVCGKNHEGYSSIADLVKDVVKTRYPGFDAQIEDTPISDLLKAGIIQHGMTDYEFIYDLAEKCNMDFAVKNKTVVFAKSRPTARPVVTLTYGKNILSYSGKDITETSKKSKAAMEQEEEILMQTAEDTIIINRKNAESAATYLDMMFVDGKLPFESDTEAAMGCYKVIMDSEASMEDIVKALMKGQSGKERRLHVRTMGDPKIRGGGTVKIEGIGYLDGTYYINPKVVHRCGSSGYICEVDLSNQQAKKKEEGEEDAGLPDPPGDV